MIDPTLERKYGVRVAGIDEVGRGPLAGPVVAAAVILPMGRSAIFDGIADSKKLGAARRETLFDLLMSEAACGVGEASVEEIDDINILQAAMLAMRRAVEALPQPPDHALVDGNRLPALPCPGDALVKGDARCRSIAAASIVAKVTRDRLMAALAAEFPGYGWERNAGYGTKEHLAALETLGVTPHHRRSFRPVREVNSLTF